MPTTAPPDTMNLGDGFTLDPDYVAGRSIALLGKKGAGKTFCMRDMVEEFTHCGVPSITFDPMGVFWGLRVSGPNGHPALPITIYGGDHGDADLDYTQGAELADYFLSNGQSMILDMSQFMARGHEIQFAHAFLDHLYRHNVTRRLVHTLIDEADLYCPQKTQNQKEAALSVVMENIVRRGRNRGIGTTLATQRPASLSKNVLTQVDVLAILRMVAPQDREAVREWVRGQGDDEAWAKIGGSLAKLQNGEAWWWIPERGVLRQVQMRFTHTYDSSPTRTRTMDIADDPDPEPLPHDVPVFGAAIEDEEQLPAPLGPPTSEEPAATIGTDLVEALGRVEVTLEALQRQVATIRATATILTTDRPDSDTNPRANGDAPSRTAMDDDLDDIPDDPTSPPDQGDVWADDGLGGN